MSYVTLDQMRALPEFTAEPTVYTDEMLLAGIAWAESRIDEETGTSWEYRTQTLTLDGTGSNWLFLAVPFIRSVVSCSIGGVAQVVTDWVYTDDGLILRPTGVFTSHSIGRNVSVTVTAGATASAPVDIEYAALALARWYVKRLLTQAPDNAIQIVSEYGTTMLAQPGKYGPTALPEVNAILRRRSHRAPKVG